MGATHWAAAILLAAIVGQAFAAEPSPKSGIHANVKSSSAVLTPAQASKLTRANSHHLKAKSQLPQEQQRQLDRLSARVRKKLFAAPLGADLMMSATELVRDSVPDLDAAEAEAAAHYVLGAIASGTPRNAETQMSFNLQYLQLLSQMQALNGDYEALSAIFKTKHDAVENSIGNVR
jgi:hypothetical protein